jgi:hypothetical protein
MSFVQRVFAASLAMTGFGRKGSFCESESPGVLSDIFQRIISTGKNRSKTLTRLKGGNCEVLETKKEAGLFCPKPAATHKQVSQCNKCESKASRGAEFQPGVSG